MTELIGHKDILSYLNNCASNQTLSHAYLFIGPSSIGRMKLLEAFLLNFLPAKNLDHPDIKIIKPEKNLISIDVIRNTRSWLQHTPISSDKKVLIIDNSGAMNTEAQNAFLKILEEPGKNTYIFLLSHNRRQVLPTIYSRTVPIYFSPVPMSVLESENSGIRVGDVGNIHGRPGIALTRQDSPEESNELIQKILLSQDSSERMRIWLEAKMEKEEMKNWLESIIPDLRKQLLSKTDNSKKLSMAIRSLLESLSKPVSQNWQLVAENLIISI
jgi:DNA polymerase III delta prime subunit